MASKTTPRQFCEWLCGYLELQSLSAKEITLNEQQIARIKHYLLESLDENELETNAA